MIATVRTIGATMPRSARPGITPTGQGRIDVRVTSAHDGVPLRAGHRERDRCVQHRSLRCKKPPDCQGFSEVELIGDYSNRVS